LAQANKPHDDVLIARSSKLHRWNHAVISVQWQKRAGQMHTNKGA